MTKEHVPGVFTPTATFYDFKDGLKLNFGMFYSVKSLFNRSVIAKLNKFKSHSNNDYGMALCERVLKEVADRILKRETTICNNLNEYLLPDDVDFALKYIETSLEESSDTYAITLLTDLLSLDGIDDIHIGNLRICKLQEEEKEKYLSVKEKGWLGLLGPSSLVREHWHNLTAIQATQEGLHLQDEASMVFSKALNQFRNLFSYLLLCEYKLEKVRGDKFRINTEDLSYEIWNKRRSKGIQKYYIEKLKGSKIMLLDTNFLDPSISNKKVTLTEEGLNRIKTDCAFENFKKVIKEKDGNEVAKKIIRAMDWFLQARLEDDMTDSVIKYFIALESLFSTGSSGLNSKTICDNIAMACDYEIKGRLEYAERFSDLLKWRNRIVHHGESFEDNPKRWRDLELLEIGITWSIFCVMLLYDKICAIGKRGDSINRYFDNRRLAASII